MEVAESSSRRLSLFPGSRRLRLRSRSLGLQQHHKPGAARPEELLLHEKLRKETSARCSAPSAHPDPAHCVWAAQNAALERSTPSIPWGLKMFAVPEPDTKTLLPRVTPALLQAWIPTESGSIRAPSSKVTLSGSLKEPDTSNSHQRGLWGVMRKDIAFEMLKPQTRV